MTPDRWREVKRTFLDVIEVPEGERPHALAWLCAGDPELRREVETMLAGHARTRGPLDPPPPPPSSLIGDTLGPYRLLRTIGRGGMGTVYLAERADRQFEQRVAIKVVARGLETEVMVERFRQERQILARLEHPNIGRLLDGGTTEGGHPYLVMELVEGLPVDRYCRRHGLGVEDRLRLFRKICVAVHHAHQHLVVHRDLKPANILVTPEGEPKLLDFGTAKLLEPAAPFAAPTVTGMWLLTPAYASPEQMRGEAVTTAADVYGLGAVLYALLAGCPPFPVDRLTPETIRTVCEDEPAPPSAALEALRDGGPSAAHRLEGDLDAIVLRALRKEPAHRYASAIALADDLDRHLGHRPVIARSGTLRYRAGRFVRRHRVGMVAAGLVALSLIAGGGGAVWQWREAESARRAAVAERNRAEQTNQIMQAMFARADPDRHGGRELSLVEVLDDQIDYLAADREDLDPTIRALLFESIGDALMALRQFAPASRAFEAALEIRNRQAPDDAEAVARDLALLGKASLRLEDYDRAGSLLSQALRRRLQLDRGASWAVADLIDDLGWLNARTGAIAAAEGRIRFALEMRRALAARSTGDEDHPEVVQSLANLGVVLSHDAARFEEAVAAFEAALAMRGRLGLATVADAITDHNNYAILLAQQARIARQAEDPARAAELWRTAEGHFRRALAIDRRRIVEDHPERASILESLGESLYRRGRLAGDPDRQRALYLDARAQLEASLAIRRQVYGDAGHGDLYRSHHLLGRVTRRLRDENAARDHYRRAIVWAGRHPEAIPQNALASLRREAGG